MVKPSLHIVSQPNGSIGEITKDLIRGLKTEFVITQEIYEYPVGFDYLLCHYLNDKIIENPAFNLFGRKILILPLDGNYLSRKSISQINSFDLVITPSLVGKEILLNNRVIKPIEIIPNFYHTPKPKSQYLYLPELPAKTIFYHESTLVPRKNTEVLYSAFIKAFSDQPYTNNVCLVVKGPEYNISNTKYLEACKQQAIDLQKQYKNPVQILKISQYLEPHVLDSIWSKVNAYVSFAKIEGFGIPLLKAACRQIPIITLNNSLSGYTDFLNTDNCYMSNSRIETQEFQPGSIYNSDSEWQIPVSEDQLIQNLRTCYEDLKKNTLKTVNTRGIKHMEYSKIIKQYVKYIKKT